MSIILSRPMESTSAISHDEFRPTHQEGARKRQSEEVRGGNRDEPAPSFEVRKEPGRTRADHHRRAVLGNRRGVLAVEGSGCRDGRRQGPGRTRGRGVRRREAHHPSHVGLRPKVAGKGGPRRPPEQETEACDGFRRHAIMNAATIGSLSLVPKRGENRGHAESGATQRSNEPGPGKGYGSGTHGPPYRARTEIPVPSTR